MSTRYMLDKSAAYRTRVPAVYERVAPLLDRGLIATCGIADLEYGVSARSADDHLTLRATRRDALEYLTTPDEAWDRAWYVQGELARDGLHRSVKVPDLIVAAVAEHHAVTVLHYDHDFDRIAEVTGQPVEWVVPRGSAD
jgi:predicted nucleic acid-binding protein